MKKSLLLIALSLTLTACAASHAPSAPPAAQTIAGEVPAIRMQLNTQDVNIINRAYAIPQTPPYIGHLFTPTVAEAVDEWAKDRIHAAGTVGHTTVIIKDASLTQRPVVMDDGMTSFMWRQQGLKYIGRVEVEIHTQAPETGSGFATANAVHSITLPENPSEEEKSIAYQKLMVAMIHDLDASMQQAVQDHLKGFLIKAEPPAPLPPAAPTTPSEAEPTMPAPPSLVTAPDAAAPAAPALEPPADSAPLVISAPDTGNVPATAEPSGDMQPVIISAPPPAGAN